MKALSLPHLSLSRAPSPSRGNQKSPLPTPTALSYSDALPTIITAEKRTSFLGAALRRSTSRSVTPTVDPAPTLTNPNGSALPPSRSSSSSQRGKSRSSRSSGGPKPRSTSSGPTFAPLSAANTVVPTTTPASGVGSNALSSLAMTHSSSQPPLTRRVPVLGPVLPGASAPLTTSASTLAGTTQLEENYVGRVGLRLSEAINRVFVNAPTDHSHPVVAQGLGVKGVRSVPNALKAKELGDIIFAELEAAVPDAYLLRTLLRSSVIKSLSLFLTRLSALLLAPTAPAYLPSAPAATVLSTLILPATTLSAPTPHPPTKAATPSPSLTSSSPFSSSGSGVPPCLTYNLTLVKCALAVKAGLVRSRKLGVSPIAETLRPWEEKLDELVARVMSLLICGIKDGVRNVCLGARAGLDNGPTAAGSIVSSAGSITSSAGRGLSLGRTTNSSPSLLQSSTFTSSANSVAQAGRALALGRTANSSTLSLQTSSSASAAVAAASIWLKELGSILIGTGQLLTKLELEEDGREKDRWLVAVGTCAVWKGMLGLAARPLGGEGIISASASSASVSSLDHEVPAPVVLAPAATTSLASKTSVLLNKLSPSPPTSPPLKASTPLHPELPSSSSTVTTTLTPSQVAADERFLRLLCHLEALERSLTSFTSFLSPCPLSSSLSHPRPEETCQDCGLCKTRRTFDPESSSEDEENDNGRQVGGLAHSAMREAMQALSAMIVVVRSTGSVKGREMLRKAMSVGIHDEEVKQKKDGIKPLKPFDLLALDPTPAPPSSTRTSTSSRSSSSPSTPAICPTLSAALNTLPALLLLHLLASRLSPSLGFKLPHELWGLSWDAYEKELRGFRAAEEWTEEIGWEMAGEVGRIVGEEGENGDEGLELLRLAVRRTGVEVGGTV